MSTPQHYFLNGSETAQKGGTEYVLTRNYPENYPENSGIDKGKYIHHTKRIGRKYWNHRRWYKVSSDPDEREGSHQARGPGQGRALGGLGMTDDNDVLR